MFEKKSKNQIIPVHVGIAMDGNRDWAQERNLPVFEGYQRGYDKMQQVLTWFFARGVKILSIFVFSTENWRCSQEEVNYLMKLLKQTIEENLLTEACCKGYKILISGRINELPGNLPQSCYEIMEKTNANQVGVINICLNYDGRAEIVDAVRKLVKNKAEIEQIHEGLIRKYLYQSDLPDPDVIVRTASKQQLSGFMLWQSIHSKLIFLKKYWPEIEETDIDFILKQ
ncbi:MAG: polyprenyl diphosphate synthase [Patescibacteria group bacterium]